MFDVLFFVRTKNDLAKVIVNMELQKDEPTHYDVEMRGIFYAAREVSSQLGREFKKQRYNEIKKVYSIWICMNTSENSLNKISLGNKNIIGSSRWKEDYNVINVVIIRLGKQIDEDKKHELHRLLGAIFQQNISLSEREKILQNEFDIELDGDRKERLNDMCNLGEGIWESALEQGVEQGKISGIIETCRKLNMPENEIIDKLMEIMNVSKEDAIEIYRRNSAE